MPKKAKAKDWPKYTRAQKDSVKNDLGAYLDNKYGDLSWATKLAGKKLISDATTFMQKRRADSLATVKAKAKAKIDSVMTKGQAQKRK